LEKKEEIENNQMAIRAYDEQERKMYFVIPGVNASYGIESKVKHRFTFFFLLKTGVD
jgi:hypothetical protein